MADEPRVSWSRLILLCAAAVCLAWASWILRGDGVSGSLSLECPFRKMTGWDCPGCGMTRAAHAALHGEIAAAFRFNPLGMILLPLAAAGLSLELWAWVRRDSAGPRLSLGIRGVKILALALMTFWVLRNTPWWPWPLP